MRLSDPFGGGGGVASSTSGSRAPQKGSTAYENLPSNNLHGVNVDSPTDLPPHLQAIYARELGL